MSSEWALGFGDANMAAEMPEKVRLQLRRYTLDEAWEVAWSFFRELVDVGRAAGLSRPTPEQEAFAFTERAADCVQVKCVNCGFGREPKPAKAPKS